MDGYRVVKTFPDHLFLAKDGQRFIYTPLLLPEAQIPLLQESCRRKQNIQGFLPLTEIVVPQNRTAGQSVGILSPPHCPSLPTGACPSEEQLAQTLLPLLSTLKRLHGANIRVEQLSPECIVYHDNQIKLADFYFKGRTYSPPCDIACSLSQLGQIFIRLMENGKKQGRHFGRRITSLMCSLLSPDPLQKLNSFKLAQEYELSPGEPLPASPVRIEKVDSELEKLTGNEDRKRFISTFSPPIYIKRQAIKQTPISAKRALVEELKLSPKSEKDGPSPAGSQNKRDEGFRITLIPTGERKEEPRDKKQERLREQQRLRKVMEMSSTFLSEIRNRRSGVKTGTGTAGREKTQSMSSKRESQRRKFAFEERDKQLISRILRRAN